MYNLWNNIIDLIFPVECIVCRDESLNKKLICNKCFKISMLAKSLSHCKYCGVKTHINNSCFSCMNKDQYFSDSDSVFIYNDVISILINRFKFYDCTYLARYFAEYILDYCKDSLSDIDVIIPVPLHFTKLFIRKYNQSALIAKYLGRKKNICVEYSLLKKFKITKSQSILKSNKRKSNLKNSFVVENGEKINKKVVCLLDDVITTGTTVYECSKVLSMYNPKKIKVISLARSIKD